MLKYEMIHDAAETVLGIFGFEGSEMFMEILERRIKVAIRKWWYWWLEELKEERMQDIQTEI